MTHPLRLGIAGLGTVGVGVIKIVQEHEKMLSARAGRKIMVTAISARSQSSHASTPWPVLHETGKKDRPGLSISTPCRK